MIGAFAIITQGLITNLCDAFFMSWLLAVPSLSALAVNLRKKTDLRQIHMHAHTHTHTHTLTHTSPNRAKRVKAG